MSSHQENQVRVVPLRPAQEDAAPPAAPAPVREPLLRDVVGDVLRAERLAQRRTLREVSEMARISMPYLSEIERGRKEPSSEVLAAAARALGLGLADVLRLAQGELVRLDQVRRLTAAAAFASGVGGDRSGLMRLRYQNELCLAA